MIAEKQEIAYNSKIEGEVIVSRADAVINWVRSHSVWPMPMGLACCAIELMGVGASKFDIARFGMEVMRFSPRQSDCMIVAGTVTYKMAEAGSPGLRPNGRTKVGGCDGCLCIHWRDVSFVCDTSGCGSNPPG